MTQESKRTKTLFVIFLLLFLITLFLTLFAVVTHFSDRNHKVENTRSTARNETMRAAKDIEQHLQKFQAMANEFINKLDRIKPDEKLRKEFSRYIKELNIRESELYEIGYAFEPNYYDELQLFGEKISKDDKEPKRIDETVDYLKEGEEETIWYHEAKRKDKGVWSKLFFHPKAKRWMATYSSPFYKIYSENSTGDEKEVTGVVYLRFPVENLEQFLRTLNLGENGYAFLLSKEGFFISHPTLNYDKNDSVEKLAKKPEYFQFASQCKNAIGNVNNDKKIEGKFLDPSTNHASWVVFETIPSTQWLLGTVAMDSDFISLGSSNRRLTWIGILIAISLTFLAALFLRVYRGGSREIWIFSACFSIFCAAVILQTLYLYWQAPGPRGEDANKITHQYSLERFKEDTSNRILKEQGVLPIYIPTGIFIQSISFYQEEVRLTGFIWQNYSEIDKNVDREIIISGGESEELQEVFRKKTDEMELIRWKFSMVLHKEFDYAHYPFRSENICIQLWHKKFYENIIPVPDLDAYTITIPAAKPGLSEQAVIPGWKVEKTFFSQRSHFPMTNFGLENNPRGTKLPELNFNIFIKKEFIGAAFSRMQPIFFIIVILFVLLLLTPRLEDKSDANGFSVMNVVVACFAIFLVVTISHTGLRDTLMNEGATYLDYFYFIAYISIFAVIINAFLVKHAGINFIQYQGNFIPRVLFWPVCTLILLLATLKFFY
jgi:hypothetical protein